MTPDSELEKARQRRSNSRPARRRAQEWASTTSQEVVAGAFQHGCKRLYLCRESAEYAWMLMAKMIEQTLSPHRDPGAVASALAYGVEPLKKTERGTKLRQELQARVLYTHGGRSKELGVLFRMGDDWFLYALTSAAKTSFEGENEFTKMLVEILKELRPAELVAGPFSRLARRADVGTRLLSVLQESRTTVRTFEAPAGLDLNSPGGEDTWRALLRATEYDYRANLTRLLTGVVYELKNNRFPRDGSALPYGYKKRGGDGETKNEVVLDLERRDLARRLIELAASDLTDVEIATELARAGARSRPSGYESKPADEVNNPRSLVQHLFNHLPVYVDGTYRFEHEMTLPNVDEFHGLAVHRHAPEDNGYLSADLRFPLPENGWHDPDLIREAIRKRLIDRDDKPRPAHTRDHVKPLASLGHWTDATHDYLLHCEERAYQLRRRPLAEAYDPKTGKRFAFGTYDGELLGRFPANQLHRWVADLLLTLEEQAPSDLTCPERPELSQAELQQLRDQIDEHDHQADQARKEVLRTDDDGSQQAYRELATEHQHQAAELRTRLADLERKPTTGRISLVRADEIAAVSALLRTVEDGTDPALNAALRRLLTSFK